MKMGTVRFATKREAQEYKKERAARRRNPLIKREQDLEKITACATGPRSSAVYKDADLDAIAKAIGVSHAKVQGERDALENVAGWFRLALPSNGKHAERDALENAGRPSRRTRPSKVRDKLAAFKKSLGRVMTALEDQDIGDAIRYEAWRHRMKFDDAVRSVAELSGWVESAEPATTYTDADGDMVDLVTAGNTGDVALNDLLANLSPIYKRLTGHPLRTSVGSRRRDGGRSFGPGVRFIQACLAPLQSELTDIDLTDQAVRERIRRLFQDKGKSHRKIS